MFVTNWISTTKIQKISEITNFFRHYFLSRTEVNNAPCQKVERCSTFWHGALLLARNARNVALSFDISRRRKIHLTFEDD